MYIVGGHLSHGDRDTGNVFTVPLNKYAEFNMFLDPLAAKTVFESPLNITLIPLGVQRKVSSFPKILRRLCLKNKTPEAQFAQHLLSRLSHLQQTHYRYHHMVSLSSKVLKCMDQFYCHIEIKVLLNATLLQEIFLGEILGAVALAGDNSLLKPTVQVKSIKVIAEGNEYKDGQTVIDKNQGIFVKVIENLDPEAYYDLFANELNSKNQSAVIGSFDEQKRLWSKPTVNQTQSPI